MAPNSTGAAIPYQTTVRPIVRPPDVAINMALEESVNQTVNPVRNTVPIAARNAPTSTNRDLVEVTVTSAPMRSRDTRAAKANFKAKRQIALRILQNHRRKKAAERRKVMRCKAIFLITITLLTIQWITAGLESVCAGCVDGKDGAGKPCKPCTENEKTVFKVMTFWSLMPQLLGLMALASRNRNGCLAYLIVYTAWAGIFFWANNGENPDGLILYPSLESVSGYRWELIYCFLLIVSVIVSFIGDIFKLEALEATERKRVWRTQKRCRFSIFFWHQVDKLFKGLDRQLGIEPAATEEVKKDEKL